MLITILLFVIPLLYMAGRVLGAVLSQKTEKTRFRFFGTIASLAAALITVFLAKSFFVTEAFVTEAVTPALFSGDAELAAFFAQSPALCQFLAGSAFSLVAPLLLLFSFLIFDLISWIVTLIVFAIKKKKARRLNATLSRELPTASETTEGEEEKEELPEAKATKRKGVYRTLATLGFALGSSLIVLFVWLLPVAAYAELVPAALTCVTETELLSEHDRAQLEQTLADSVDPINRHPMVKSFRFLGGSLTVDAMTSFEVGGQSVTFKEEVRELSGLAGNFLCLGNASFAEYGDAEEALFDAVSDSFASSRVLPSVLSETVQLATDAWLADDTFFGVSADAFYVDERGVFNGLVDKTVWILNQDTQPGTTDLICDDVDTTFEMLKVLIRHGALAGADGDEDLLVRLAKDGTVKDLIRVLEKNETMSALIPEITNIGMSAIGSTLGVDASVSAEYSVMMDDIASELNNIKLMSEEEQLASVRNLIGSEFEKNGLIVEDSVINDYADRMMADLVSGDGDIDSNDLLIFFSENSFEASEGNGNG